MIIKITRYYVISANFEYFNPQNSQIKIILVSCIVEFNHNSIFFYVIILNR